MTTALLFALVDAVLNERRRVSWQMRAHAHHKARWATACEELGWWRSLWPMGGGA